jgi:hypothetical protein
MAAPFNRSNGTTQQCVTKIMSLTVVNLAKTKAGAEHEVLFNKPASEALLSNI